MGLDITGIMDTGTGAIADTDMAIVKGMKEGDQNMIRIMILITIITTTIITVMDLWKDPCIIGQIK